VPDVATCYSRVVSTLDRLSDLAPERVRPLKRVEYERLVHEGLFEDEHVELLGGAIVEMSPHGTRHASAIMLLSKLLVRAAGDSAEVRTQLSFAASDESLPEPDIAVVPPGRYRDAHPSRALLLVEVSAESLRKDRVLKAEVYARAGVPEYWIVNVVDECVEVRTLPRDGAYTNVSIARPGDTLSLAVLGGAGLPVSDFLR